MTDLEGADPVSQRGVPPEVRTWKGRIRGPRGGCPPEVRIWKGQIRCPRGGRPWRSGFGRGRSGVPEGGEVRIWKGRIRGPRGGCPGGQDLEEADPGSQRGVPLRDKSAVWEAPMCSLAEGADRVPEVGVL